MNLWKGYKEQNKNHDTRRIKNGSEAFMKEDLARYWKTGHIDNPKGVNSHEGTVQFELFKGNKLKMVIKLFEILSTYILRFSNRFRHLI